MGSRTTALSCHLKKRSIRTSRLYGCKSKPTFISILNFFRNWYHSITASLLYVILIYAGQRVRIRFLLWVKFILVDGFKEAICFGWSPILVELRSSSFLDHWLDSYDARDDLVREFELFGVLHLYGVFRSGRHRLLDREIRHV